MTYLRRTGIFVIVTIIFALTAAFFITATVMSQSNISGQAQARYDREQGQKYVKVVREYLDESGYQNSGVTLSRVTEADGTMSYMVTIHHERIDRLSGEEQTALKAQLAKIPAPENVADIYHEFLVMN